MSASKLILPSQLIRIAVVQVLSKQNPKLIPPIPLTNSDPYVVRRQFFVAEDYFKALGKNAVSFPLQQTALGFHLKLADSVRHVSFAYESLGYQTCFEGAITTMTCWEKFLEKPERYFDRLSIFMTVPGIKLDYKLPTVVEPSPDDSLPEPAVSLLS